jgi:hypothetical protein
LEELKELQKDVKDILRQIGDLRVDMVGKYLTKEEFARYKAEENANKWKVAMFCVSVGGAVFAAIQWAVELGRR